MTVLATIPDGASYKDIRETLNSVMTRIAALEAAAGGVPTPALTLTGSLSYTTGSASGTVIGSIGNVPAGVTPTIAPDDGRLVVAGSESTGWLVAVGLTASLVGARNITIGATGATSVTRMVTVSAAGTNLGRAFSGPGWNLADSPITYFGRMFPCIDFFKCSLLLNEDEKGPAVAVNADGYPTAVTPGKNGVKWYVNVEGPLGPTDENGVLLEQRYVWESNYLGDQFTPTGGHFSNIVRSVVEGGTVQRVEFTVDPASLNLDTGYRINMVLPTLPTPYVAGQHWNRMYPKRMEAAYKAGQRWMPHFLARMAAVSTERMMDWVKANKEFNFKWADRPTMTTASWMNGVPIEAMIDLCNQTNQHMWFNMPVQIGVTQILTADGDGRPLSLNDDISIAYDYIDRFVGLVKAQLKPGLKCGVEYGNEDWNYQFPQYFYLRSFLPDPYPAGADYVKAWVQTGIRATRILGHMMKTAQYDDRFIPIWATQTVSTDVTEFNALGMQKAIADWGDTSSPYHDAELAARYDELGKLFQGGLACTFYFNGLIAYPEINAADKASVLGWARDTTNAGYEAAIRQLEYGDVLTGGNWGSLANYDNLIAPQRALAYKYQVPLTCYEGQIEVPAQGANGNIGFSGTEAVEIRDFTKRLYDYVGMRGLMYRCLKVVRQAGMTNIIILADSGAAGDPYATQTVAHGGLSPRVLGLQDFNTDPGPSRQLTALLETTGSYTVGSSPKTRIKVAGGIGRMTITVAGMATGRSFDGFRNITGTLTMAESKTLSVRVQDEAGNEITVTQNQIVQTSGGSVTPSPTPTPTPTPSTTSKFRFTFLRTAQGYLSDGDIRPSLSELYAVDSSGNIESVVGAVATGDQLDNGEGVAKLIDGDDTIIWTGGLGVNTVVVDYGRVVKPLSFRMKDRLETPERAPLDFNIDYSEDGGATWQRIATVFNAAYSSRVATVLLDYVAGGLTPVQGPALTPTGVTYAAGPTGFGQVMSGGYASTTVNQAALVPNPSSMTVSARFNVAAGSEPGNVAVLLSLQQRFYIYMGAGGIMGVRPQDNSGQQRDIKGTINYADGAWHTVEYSHDGTTGRVFVDGALIASLAFAPSVATNLSDMIIRDFNGNGVYAFPGLVDEVAFFQTVRHTAAHTAATTPLPNNTAGLVGLYHLDGSIAAAPTS